MMDMGTGKTISTVAVAGRMYLDGYIERLLIIAPTSVCAVWPAEFDKFGDFPCRVALLLGDHKTRVQKPKRRRSTAAQTISIPQPQVCPS